MLMGGVCRRSAWSAGGHLPRVILRRIDTRPARDRLAVWTYEEVGEEIPHGDPSVTDAERSSAGRQTIAARWQALLPGNRSRAAAQYAPAGLPEGQEAVRVWRPRGPC